MGINIVEAEGFCLSSALNVDYKIHYLLTYSCDSLRGGIWG